MFEIKKQFVNDTSINTRKIKITLEDEEIIINTANPKMDFETFNKLCRAGYSYIFDFSKKYVEREDVKNLCKICGNEFIPKSAASKYCSTDCRSKVKYYIKKSDRKKK